MIDLTALKATFKASTQGTWNVDCFYITGDHRESIVHFGGNLTPSRSKESVANAAITAAMHNSFSELVTELEGLRAQVATKRPAMQILDLLAQVSDDDRDIGLILSELKVIRDAVNSLIAIEEETKIALEQINAICGQSAVDGGVGVPQ